MFLHAYIFYYTWLSCSSCLSGFSTVFTLSLSEAITLKMDITQSNRHSTKQKRDKYEDEGRNWEGTIAERGKR